MLLKVAVLRQRMLREFGRQMMKEEEPNLCVPECSLCLKLSHVDWHVWRTGGRSQRTLDDEVLQRKQFLKAFL